MKIGILTLPLSYNYGGILQAYALQTYLQRAGHVVQVIDRRKKIPFVRTLLGTCKRAVKRYLLKEDVLVTSSSRKLRTDRLSTNTDRFIEQYIRRTEPVYSVSALKQTVKNGGFDALIVGSDQVWRKDYSPSLANYFLNFLPASSTIKRIAYGASFGEDAWKLSLSETRSYKAFIRRFNAVGVREASGVGLCRKYLDIDAVQVPDPTLLLTVDDYLSLTDGGESPASNRLLVYMLDPVPEKKDAVDFIGANKGLQPYRFNMPASEFSASGEEKVAGPMEDWLAAFRDAAYVVTDSFHGCVFSILFNKPFIVYGNRERGITRFISLLEMFGLTDRLISSPDELSINRLDAPISWVSVNTVLQEQRRSASRFFGGCL